MAPKQQKQQVSWAQAFRDIIVKAMDKGQLLPVLFFLITLAFIFRMPEDKVFEIGQLFLNGFIDLSLMGWVGMAVVCILWAGHARTMRRKHSAEYRRIGLEKSKLQQAQVNVKLGSSD